MDDLPTFGEASENERELALHRLHSIKFPNAEDLHGGVTQRKEFQVCESELSHLFRSGVAFFVSLQCRVESACHVTTGGERELIALPIDLHESVNVARIPIAGLLLNQFPDL